MASSLWLFPSLFESVSTGEENKALCALPGDDKIHVEVQNAPRPDGLNGEFYKKSLPLIAKDLNIFVQYV